MNKKLVLVASPPACGKTYVSELIAKSIKNPVYLDKDDLGDLIRASFASSGKEVDMDGDFYKNNLRSAEYSTILNIALSALRFEDCVVLNAPFLKEVRDLKYMQNLKKKVNEAGAELFLIWVSASTDVCYERMKKRNSDRDTLKLENWDDYIKNIDFTPPGELEVNGGVDEFIIIDTNTDASLKRTLEETLKRLRENGND